MYLGWDIGIKHLSYCMMDYIDNNGIIEYKIIDWGIINLMTHIKEKNICTSLKKNKDCCNNTALYYNINNNNEYYCNLHYKSIKNKSDINKITDKVLCNKCKKNASIHDVDNNIYYCGKHGKNISLLSCDKIVQGPATKMPLFTLGKILYRELDKKPELLNANYICIENQPASKNPTMKSIQMILYSYFIMKSINKQIFINEIIMMSAKNKLKIYKNEYGTIDTSNIMKTKNKYLQRKKLAIETTTIYLNNEYMDSNWRPYFLENKYKKDDLSDSYLMTRFYIAKNKKLL